MYVKDAALMVMLRLRTAGVHPKVGVGQLGRGALTALPLLQAASDAIEQRFVFNKPYKIQIKHNTGSDTSQRPKKVEDVESTPDR